MGSPRETGSGRIGDPARRGRPGGSAATRGSPDSGSLVGGGARGSAMVRSATGISERRRAGALAAIALACLAAAPAATESCGGPAPVDRHVVDLGGTSPDELEARVEALGGRVLRWQPQIDVAVVEGLDDAAAAELAAGGRGPLLVPGGSPAMIADAPPPRGPGG